MNSRSYLNLCKISSGGSFPKPPTRDALLTSINLFQGVTVTTKQYGTFNSFGPEVSGLDYPEDRQAFYKAHYDAGSRLLQIGWAGTGYTSGGFTFPVPGTFNRWVNDLNGFCDRIAEIIEFGFTGAMVMMPGDGEPNDTWEYGRVWLMNHAPDLVAAMKAYKKADLTKYSILMPGYDGVWYGWKSGQAVLDYGWMMRGLLPEGYLGIEYTSGVCHLGNGKSDYTMPGGLSCFDIFYQEFNYLPLEEPNQIWQVGARMLGPKYIRPADQPKDDDPGAPFPAGSADDYLSNGTSRGPFYTCGWEMLTYGWVRSLIDLQFVEQTRNYIRNVGWSISG